MAGMQARRCCCISLPTGHQLAVPLLSTAFTSMRPAVPAWTSKCFQCCVLIQFLPPKHTSYVLLQREPRVHLDDRFP